MDAHDRAVDRHKLDLLYDRLKKAERDGDVLRAAAINLQIIRRSERVAGRTDELRKAER